MSVALIELLTWANSLPYWEKFALDYIMADKSFLDEDYDRLLNYILEDANLKEKNTPRPDLNFTSVGINSRSDGQRLVLLEIRNLQNINALATGQSMTFSQQLTTIYGANGSGKSGYARVLGCAAFSRGDREVLSDITQPIGQNAVRAADIVVSEDESIRVIEYRIGNRCSELAPFYVFDSTSVEVHISKSNTISFSPYGLSFLTRLSEITDACRDKLQQKVKAYLAPHSFTPFFQGETEVSRAITTLGPRTNTKDLEKLATLSEDDLSEFQQLDVKIAQLKSENIPEQISEFQQTITDLNNLINGLNLIQRQLSDEAISSIDDTIKLLLKRQAVSQLASVDQFKTEDFSQIGSPAWYDFIRAAKALAELEKKNNEAYPTHQDACLLCQHPLSDESRGLIVRLWSFLASNAQAQLRETEEDLKRKRRVLKSINFDCFGEQFVSYRFLKSHDETVMNAVKQFIQAAHQRFEGALRNIDELRTESLESMPRDCVMEVQRIINGVKLRIEELKKLNPEQKIKELENQRLVLQHRITLSEKLPEIKIYLDQRKRAEKAIKAGGNTRHITQKYNDLFKQLVTDRYIEVFERILGDLGRPLKVKVATRGRKGETIKQIVLEATTPNNEEKATPSRVLSEGEKRAVALADFLAEATLDEASAGIILDDPVTSLDFEWKEAVAQRLVQEVMNRQVIIFTHDLPFLYLLNLYAEQRRVDIKSHWIKRGESDGKPGYIFSESSPLLEKDYRNPVKAIELYQKAKITEAPDVQEALLRQGFGYLRSTYEAFIIHDLLEEVVLRFDLRVSIRRLKNIVWDQSIIDDVIAKCTYLSRFIDAHLQSDLFTTQKPTPLMLKAEIDFFQGLQKKLKALKKASNSHSS